MALMDSILRVLLTGAMVQVFPSSHLRCWRVPLEPILALPTIQHSLRALTSDYSASRHRDGITILPIVVIPVGLLAISPSPGLRSKPAIHFTLSAINFYNHPMLWENFRGWQGQGWFGYLSLRRKVKQNCRWHGRVKEKIQW